MSKSFSPAPKNSSLISKNIFIDTHHRTSVRLEPDMWDALTEIANRECESIHTLCSRVARSKTDETSLTAAIRVFVMTYYRDIARNIFTIHELKPNKTVNKFSEKQFGQYLAFPDFTWISQKITA
jgi:predicted DNA-binding ribbon-helix-helix protein